MRTVGIEPSVSEIGHRKRRHDRVPDTRQKAKRRKSRDGDETRRWVYSSRRDLSAFKERFRIVSYNILGVENASKHMELYSRVDPRYLSWDRRKKQIRNELRHYNADVLCLQEVDRFDDLADILHEDGYSGVYKGRTGEASDGCAVFWKKGRFSLIHEESIEFRKFGLRDNVAQLCLLKVCPDCPNASISKDPDSEIAETVSNQTLLVGNIHVLFNPNRGDIKLGQIRVLLEKAHAILQERGKCPVVISGDLNSMPQSAVYQFLSSSSLNILSCDRKKISGQIEYPLNQIPFTRNASRCHPVFKSNLTMMYRWSKEEICLAAGSADSTHLQNPLKLLSAYKEVPGNLKTRDHNGEPLATSFHSKFLGTVDYVWHSAGLVPVGVLETLPINALRRLGGLPSLKWGSDHLSLVCEYAFVGA